MASRLVWLRFATVALLCISRASAAAEGMGALSPNRLTCEYLVDPLGIDVIKPRLGWQLTSTSDKPVRGEGQTAYQVLVSSTTGKLEQNVGDCWDSGKVESDRSTQIEYGGPALTSGDRRYWKVRVWDRAGRAGEFSPAAFFEMGLLQRSDWKAEWIAEDSAPAATLVEGRRGQALRLDGQGQSLRVDHRASLKPRDAITISAWIRPKSVPAAWGHLYRKDDNGARHLLAIGRGEPGFGVWLGLAIDGKYREFLGRVEPIELIDGQWHHVAGTYDGKAVRLFVDGRVVESAAQAGSLDQTRASGPLSQSADQPAFIGSSRGESEFFAGDIDDLAIHKRALTPDEIAQLAESGAESDVSREDIIALWTFDGNLHDVGGPPARALSSSRSASAPLLRKDFKVRSGLRRARAYVSGIGYYELHLNGAKVGDHVLDPASSFYTNDQPWPLIDRTLYVTYDVTDRVREGANAVGLWLGNGWYSNDGAAPGRQPYGDRPKAIAQLVLDYDNGSREVVGTDGTWKLSASPIVANEICLGETYDARLEQPGWSSPGFDDAKWLPAAVIDSPSKSKLLAAQMLEPCRIISTRPPEKVTESEKGVFVFDFGQHASGWARLRVRGPAGTTVRVRYAGAVYDDGRLDVRNNQVASQTDHYTLKGEGEETWEPRFSFHGFRYVELTGLPDRPGADSLVACHTRNDARLTSKFICSNPLINQLESNVRWTMATSLQGVPQDAAERAERMGWLGDTGFVAEDYFVNLDMAAFWTKWLHDIRDTQRPNGDVPVISPIHLGRVPGMNPEKAWRGAPDWTATYPLLVWYMHHYYGDRRIVEEHYEPLRKLVAFWQTQAKDDILPSVLGDHMEPQPDGSGSYRPKNTPADLTTTCYYYRVVRMMSDLAKLVGREDEAREYDALAARIQTAFHNHFYSAQRKGYGTGSQASNAVPLAMDIVPAEYRDTVLTSLIEEIDVRHKGHLSTGIIGTKGLVDALPKHGRADVMYRIATQTDYPSWGHAIRRGATSIWEDFGGAPSLSLNMKMFGSAGKFIHQDLAGIAPESAGYKRAVIRPCVVGDLQHARGVQETVNGRFEVEWKRADGSLSLAVVVPPGAAATVVVPKIGDKETILESGQTVWQNGKFQSGVPGVSGALDAASAVKMDIASGRYVFEVQSQQ